MLLRYSHRPHLRTQCLSCTFRIRVNWRLTWRHCKIRSAQLQMLWIKLPKHWRHKSTRNHPKGTELPREGMKDTVVHQEITIAMAEGILVPETDPGAETGIEIATGTEVEIGTDPGVVITVTDHKTAHGAETEDLGDLQAPTKVVGIVVKQTTSGQDVPSKRELTSWPTNCKTSSSIEMVQERESPDQEHFKSGPTVRSHLSSQKKGYISWKMKWWIGWRISLMQSCIRDMGMC